MNLSEGIYQTADYDMENQADIIRTQLRRERRLRYEQAISSSHRRHEASIYYLGGFVIVFTVLFVFVCSTFSDRF